jgi:hypothetical protein
VEMTLTRKVFTNESSIGELQVNGTFECYTLEDPVRPEKIAKVTAIPKGRYQVDLTHSKRFNCLMPEVMNVVGFGGIRIHTGNTAADTEGCILVGQNTAVNRIGGSRLAYNALFQKIQQAKKRGEKIWLDIKHVLPDTDGLVFDGKSLTWYRAGQKYMSWPAVSGRPGYHLKAFQTVRDRGPLPEGKWEVRQREYQRMPNRSWVEKILAEFGRTAWPGGESSWGQHRVWLKPSSETNTHGRSGFSIHGGDTPGSAGCIDLTHSMPSFVQEFLKYGKDLELTVEYEPKSAD